MSQSGSVTTVDVVSRIFCDAVKDVILGAAGTSVTYAPTIQKVPSISLKPDIGCFIQFDGDYSGLFIMNLSGEAALEIYQNSMRYMGLPEEEIVTDWESDEVVNCVGEFMNQIIGKARQMIQQRYGLTASNNQPKAISISSAITMYVATMLHQPQCRRLSFRTEKNHPFYVEMNMEQTEFISLEPVAEDRDEQGVQEQVDSVLAGDASIVTDHASEGRTREKMSDEGDEDLDIDALLSQYGK